MLCICHSGFGDLGSEATPRQQDWGSWWRSCQEVERKDGERDGAQEMSPFKMSFALLFPFGVSLVVGCNRYSLYEILEKKDK